MIKCRAKSLEIQELKLLNLLPVKSLSKIGKNVYFFYLQCFQVSIFNQSCNKTLANWDVNYYLFGKRKIK